MTSLSWVLLCFMLPVLFEVEVDCGGAINSTSHYIWFADFSAKWYTSWKFKKQLGLKPLLIRYCRKDRFNIYVPVPNMPQTYFLAKGVKAVAEKIQSFIYNTALLLWKWDTTEVITAKNSVCIIFKLSSQVRPQTYPLLFLFFIPYLLDVTDISLPSSPSSVLQRHVFCLFLIVGSFLWRDVRYNPLFPTTPPSHAQKKGKVWKWGQTSVGCCLLLSSPVLPTSSPTFSFPSCSPANSSSFHVKPITLQVGWVILCLPVL